MTDDSIKKRRLASTAPKEALKNVSESDKRPARRAAVTKSKGLLTMIGDFDIESWLHDHCTGFRREARELVFDHHTGETSVLLIREATDCSLLPVVSEPLKPFYERYVGASIGGSQIMVPTSVVGGIRISQGFLLPDLYQAQTQISELGIAVPAGDEVFMVEAAWMFAYSYRREGNQFRLIEFDRDFKTERTIESIPDIFENWWEMENGN